MGVSQRAAPAPMRNSMRPPPRPPAATGRAPSPADTLTSGAKRKEREFDQDESEETNIRVVVRCRGRSAREVKENSGVVVSTNGVKGKNVELSMGPNAISNKTYHFDRVFSPAADQAIVFDDVVAPILNEMLSGFNCTIFAYGQTGTGKTYTMSGDMTDSLGLLSDEAGIVPRTLYSLFQRLEADGVECAVKCSFIELYNEELRDLLAADDGVKLKIFDDASRKSHAATLVQGMEESHINSAAAGIKLLQRGSHRRQVAATKCNDLSSRSHTVFTITTYVKKPNGDEDFICAGKLNLVDLAGSENIQRSGAENKRAAEAGLINKSLLTLGRVINALVDKGSHIPYRESKLTRLLQDSLGGRTKTCIIATVSPARSNLEETISTLDYAFRAKNIRNKPQVNSMISKKTLLREFTAEIEKLKSELIATRQRNGVYLSNEQYEEITVESESRRILTEEQRARIETMEVSLRNKVQELFNLTNSLTTLKRDSESTRATLASTSDVLFKTESVLKDTEELLEDERALRQAHEETEGALRSMGNELIHTIATSVRDLTAAQEKLRRRSNLHHQNQQAWQTSAERIGQTCADVEQQVSSFQQTHAALLTTSSQRLEEYVSEETVKLNSCRQMLMSKVSELETSQTAIETRSNSAHAAMNDVFGEIKLLREEVKDRVGDGLKGLNEAAAKISGEVITELDRFHEQLHSSYSSLGKEIKSLFEDMTKQLTSQRKENDRLRRQLQLAQRKKIDATRGASRQLQECLEEERRLSQQERQQLKEQIFALIDASASRQEERISTKVVQIQAHLDESTDTFEQADEAYTSGMDIWAEKDQGLIDRVAQSKEDLKGRMKRDWTAINTKNTAIQSSTEAVHKETVKIVDAQLGRMATQMSALDEFVTRARAQNDQMREDHKSGLLQLSVQVAQLHASISDSLDARHSELEKVNEDTQATTDEMGAVATGLVNTVSEPLASLREGMYKTGLQDYIPTGETPEKRDWTYPMNLPETAKHQSIIARRRGVPDPTIEAKSPSKARTPGRSPKKQGSPRKGSPSKASSPSKTKVFNDEKTLRTTVNMPLKPAAAESVVEPLKGLKEIDVNVIPRPASAAAGRLDESQGPTHPFSKSAGLGGQPPLKRHATAPGQPQPLKGLLPSPHFEEPIPHTPATTTTATVASHDDDPAIPTEAEAEPEGPDTATREHFHPTVHYIFADDEPDIITEAASEWQVLKTNITSAPTIGEQDGDEGLMLRIEGRGHTPTDAPQARAGEREQESVEDLIERFQKRLDDIRHVMLTGRGQEHGGEDEG
ncbi:hypothetical protein DV736_g1099, partial [Chaetothyriales sp. CBS 134916]